MKLEKLDTKKNLLYNFETTLGIKKKYVLRFVSVFCLSFLCFNSLFRPRNCKHWLEYQQCFVNNRFRIEGLVDLDTISFIDVFERLIHATIQ